MIMYLECPGVNSIVRLLMHPLHHYFPRHFFCEKLFVVVVVVVVVEILMGERKIVFVVVNKE